MPLWAAPTSARQALDVVAGWLQDQASPMDEAGLGDRAAKVTAFGEVDGSPAYYVVKLDPVGLVVVPGDDAVEPIIAFGPGDGFDPSPSNPLGALVSSDLPGRIMAARQGEASAQGLREATQAAQAKWARYLALAGRPAGARQGVSSVSDVRVSPLIQSTWDQSTAGGVNTYNIYTPSNYVCGCVATAMAQLMRFHQYPTVGVGTGSFSISVCDSSTTRALRGGNGSGGAYDWTNMVLSAGASTSQTQRNAIGALTADAGVSVNMDYCSGGSGTDTLLAGTAFKSTFTYANAVKGYYSGSNIPATNRNNMVNANLDAGYPILFGITGAGGHAIVGDGYGYNASTLYHHLNMGWSGSNNYWYNLPTIDTSYYSFNSVYKVVYNVYTTGTGEIVSGRVMDGSGNPLSGVAITATRSGGGTATATTNAKGIYALPKIQSASTYTITAAKSGYSFSSRQVSTATSTDYSITTGNVWGADFTGTAASQTGSLTVTLSPTGAVSAGARWAVDGGAWQTSGATVSGLSVGSHQVTFLTVSGYTAPSAQTATVAANQTTSLTGTYSATSQTGSLTVTLSPAGAVSAGARWAVDGGAWQTSGATVSGLSVGSHAITFKTVSGYAAPAGMTATIQAGQTASLSAVYQANNCRYVMNANAAYSWVGDSGATVLTTSADDYVYTVPLGFSFNYDGTAYSSMYVSTNGFVSFTDNVSANSNESIPNVATPNALLAVYWDDLYLTSALGSSLSYQTIGASPNAKGVVTWKNVTHYDFRNSTGYVITFQLILEQATGKITMQYADVLLGNTAYDKGASATIGIENHGGTAGTQYGYSQAVLHDGQAIAFTRANKALCGGACIKLLLGN